MKENRIVILTLTILAICPIIHAQSDGWSFGISGAFHNEIHDKNLGNYDLVHEPGTGSSQFLGLGIQLEKNIGTNWAINTGIQYINRSYYYENRFIFYNHCYFAEEGEACEEILLSTKRFGYKTIEILFGGKRRLSMNEKWETFLNLNGLIAVDLQSYYNGPRKIKGNAFHLFAGSMISEIGVSRNFGEHVRLDLAPFIRLINLKREDPVLYGDQKNLTFLNDFGIKMLFMYNL